MTADDPGSGMIRASSESLADPVRCPKCGKDLAGIEGTTVCPECWTALSVTRTVPDDRPCLRCGYNLRGLPESGVCPECGTPVSLSLRGALLEYSSAEYVASLHRGVFLVELGLAIGIVAMVVVVLGTVGMAATGAGTPPAWFMWLAGVGSIALNLLSLAGWWLLSTPDPAFVGRDKGTTARQVLRATLVIAAAAAVLSLFTEVAAGGPRFTGPGPGATPGPFSAMMLLAMLVQFGAMIAWIVQFFAAMKYLQWLGPRIPDASITKRARTYMWLLPLIYVGGGVCLGIGILIAFLMYIRLLDNLRTGLRAVRRRIESGTPIVLPA